MSTHTKKTVDDYTVFELAGLNSLKPNEKKDVLKSLTELIWKEFLSDALPHAASLETMNQLKSMALNKRSPEEIVEHMMINTPDFVEQFLEVCRTIKKRFIDAVIQSKYERLQRDKNYAKTEKERDAIQVKIETILDAAQCLREEKWEQLKQTVF